MSPFDDIAQDIRQKSGDEKMALFPFLAAIVFANVYVHCKEVQNIVLM